MSCRVKKVQKAEKLKMKQRRVIRQQALKDHWHRRTLEALSAAAALVLMPLADGPDLSLSAAYHIGRCSDLLCLAETDRLDKPPRAPVNENQFWPQRGIFKDRGTEFGSLVGGVGGGAPCESVRSAPGAPFRPPQGNPLHQIAAVKRLLGPR